MTDMLSSINLPSFASRRSTSTKLSKISPKTQISMKHLGDGLAPACPLLPVLHHKQLLIFALETRH